MTRIKWSKELVTEKIRNLYSSGKDLSYKGIHKPYRSLEYAAERYFGSWKKAIEDAGFNYDDITRRILHSRNKNQIVSEIKQVHQREGKLNSNYIQRNHGALYGAARSYFGSWGQAVEAAGFNYNKIMIEPPPQLRRSMNSKKKVIKEMLRRQCCGLSLNTWTMRKEDSSLYRAARREFGKNGWQKALLAAGLDPDAVQENMSWTKGKIRNRIYLLLRINSPLYRRFLVMNGMWNLVRAAERLFGSWRAAIESCGLDYEEVKSRRRKWTPRLIVDEVLILKQRGIRLNSKTVRILRRDLHDAAYAYFGSWGQAVEAAGFSYRQESINWTYQAWLKTLTPQQLGTISKRMDKLAKQRRGSNASRRGKNTNR